MERRASLARDQAAETLENAGILDISPSFSRDRKRVERELEGSGAARELASLLPQRQANEKAHSMPPILHDVDLPVLAFLVLFWLDDLPEREDPLRVTRFDLNGEVRSTQAAVRSLT